MRPKNAKELPSCFTNTDVECIGASKLRIVEKPNTTIRGIVCHDRFSNTITSFVCGHTIDQKKLRFATSSFLIAGGDGYTMLAGKGTDPSRNPANAQRAGGIDSNIAAAYLKQSGFNQTIEAGFKVEPSRITFMNCSVPTRPSN